eukprot:evm.model.NODE_13071_length_7814_cov_54.928207.3
MVALNDASEDRAGPVTALDTALPTNEAELETKSRSLNLENDDAGKESLALSGLTSATRDDPDLLPEERWNEAWQSHLDFIK